MKVPPLRASLMTVTCLKTTSLMKTRTFGALLMKVSLYKDLLYPFLRIYNKQTLMMKSRLGVTMGQVSHQLQTFPRGLVKNLGVVTSAAPPTLASSSKPFVSGTTTSKSRGSLTAS